MRIFHIASCGNSGHKLQQIQLDHEITNPQSHWYELSFGSAVDVLLEFFRRQSTSLDFLQNMSANNLILEAREKESSLQVVIKVRIINFSWRVARGNTNLIFCIRYIFGRHIEAELIP